MPLIVIPDDERAVVSVSSAYARLNGMDVRAYASSPSNQAELIERIRDAKFVINVRARTRFTPVNNLRKAGHKEKLKHKPQRELDLARGRNCANRTEIRQRCGHRSAEALRLRSDEIRCAIDRVDFRHIQVVEEIECFG